MKMVRLQFRQGGRKMKDYICCISYRFLEFIQRCHLGYETPQKIKMQILHWIEK
jgi:hypothetical protein